MVFVLLIKKKGKPKPTKKPQKSINKKSTKYMVFHGGSEPYL